MPEAAICGTCGDSAQIRRLNELGFGPENEHKAIYMCDDCLEQREAKSWHIDEATGQRVYEALHGRHQASHQRYSYLLEGAERIHLMRLQPDWVDQQAADV